MTAGRFLLFALALPLLFALTLVVVEGWPFFDALYMAVITLTTVGFAEVRPLGEAGRLVVILYLVVGLGGFLFGVVRIGELMLQAHFDAFLEKRKMDKMLARVSGHEIVCGYGRVGSRLAPELAANDREVLVVDRDPGRLERARKDGFLAVEGDATDDETLERAGLTRARGLAAVLPHDADNLYVVMSARLLREDLQIIARAGDEKNVVKLERAGANRVVSVYDASAQKMARLLTNSNLEDFMQVLSGRAGELDLAEIVIGRDAPYCDRTLAEADFDARGILVVAHRRPEGEFRLPPPAATRLKEGDTLIAFGPADAVVELLDSDGDG